MKTMYRHYKGALYEVIGETTHTETEEILVLYRAPSKPEKIRARPREMFYESVAIDDKLIPRFQETKA